MRAQATPVASRYADSQRWWIASQLVTRNPELQMHLQVDLIDGEALVLTLPTSTTILPEVGARLRIVLDRLGIRLIAPSMFAPLLWAEVLSFANPLELVIRIERSLGLIPQTTNEQGLPSRPLAYTVLALLLAARVNDAEGWDVRSLAPELLGVDDWGPTDLTRFPTLTDRMLGIFELDIARGIEPQVRPAWVLYRGFAPIAAFDEADGLHVHGIRFSLREIYSGTGYDLARTTDSVSILIG